MVVVVVVVVMRVGGRVPGLEVGATDVPILGLIVGRPAAAIAAPAVTSHVMARRLDPVAADQTIGQRGAVMLDVLANLVNVHLLTASPAMENRPVGRQVARSATVAVRLVNSVTDGPTEAARQAAVRLWLVAVDPVLRDRESGAQTPVCRGQEGVVPRAGSAGSAPSRLRMLNAVPPRCARLAALAVRRSLRTRFARRLSLVRPRSGLTKGQFATRLSEQSLGAARRRPRAGRKKLIQKWSPRFTAWSTPSAPRVFQSGWPRLPGRLIANDLTMPVGW